MSDMNDLVVCRSSDVIAAEINGIKEQIKKTVRTTMLTGAMEIGRLLIEAKAVVQHGEWGQWLQDNVDYSQTTANDMMRLYTEYADTQLSLDGGPSNEELFGMLEPSKALALLALPETERKAFVQENPVEDMSVRKLKEELARVKQEKEKAEADAEKARETTADASALALEAEAKLKNAELRRDEAVKAAVSAEREKLQKQLKTTRENLDKAMAREKEKEKQIDLLKAKLEEAESEEDDAPKQDEVSPETQRLQAEVERLEKALRAADPAYAKFGVLLEQYQQKFYELIDTANEADDPTNRAKMREILTRVHAGFTAELTEE